MLKHYKKLFLAFVALFSVFVLASCSQKQSNSQSAAQTEAPKVETIAGEWESVYELDSLQKAFFPKGMKSYTFAKFIEAFKDFKMKLSVDGTSAKLSYQYDSKKFAKAFYEISKDKNKMTEDEFVSRYINGQTEFVQNFKKYKASMDTSTGTYSYEATGTIDESAKTVTFDEGLIILDSFPLTTADKDHRFDPATYNYEVKDGILTIYADMKTKDNLPVHFELNFKRVPSTEKKQKGDVTMFKQYLKPLLIAGCSLLMLAGCGNQTATTTTTTAPSNPLEGKWEQIDFRSTLERALGYNDFTEEIPRRLIYSDAFKDVKPTLTITGNSAVYDLTATTNVAVGNFYDYGKAQKLTSIEGTKEQYIKNQYEDLKKQLEIYNNMKGPLSFEFNDEKYEIHQTLKEITINESAGTFEFKNAPMFISLVTFSNEKFVIPVTYKYTLEDGILTLTLEQPKTLSGEEKIVGYFTMRFKKVAE